jgi:hypothetical protein
MGLRIGSLAKGWNYTWVGRRLILNIAVRRVILRFAQNDTGRGVALLIGRSEV